MTLIRRLGAWLRGAGAWLLAALSAVVAWALWERRGRRRAEARADLEEDLVDIETDRLEAEAAARKQAADERAQVELERAAAEVKAKVDIQAAERALERVREEHRETGHVTEESRRLFEEMKAQGRVP